MPRIIELEPHVADLIAAGEVVERPASVVKELMENSIDAGAGIITVEINAGGMAYIRVTDNGCGIAPEDAGTAFLRHATSKLRDAEGLEAIGTLGFRGEALAAIAAVSRIGLLTREHGAGEGVSLSLEAGEVMDISPAGCPEGTTIIVRDLFFNTPARLKFMKSDRAESSAVASAVLRCALSHPEVSFRFLKDGKSEYHTPGDSRVDSCIYSLFGREFSAGLIEASSADETVSVSGYVSLPAAARGNRSYQFFFVNGRPIQSRTLQAALEQAFANLLPTGRFPACALYVIARPGDVDVNVHPAKTEIKFVSDKQVFDGVYYAALSALSRRSAPDGQLPGDGELTVNVAGNGNTVTRHDAQFVNQSFQSKPEHRRPSGNGGGFRSLHVDEYRQKYGAVDPKPGESAIPSFDAAQDKKNRAGAEDDGLPNGRLSDSSRQMEFAGVHSGEVSVSGGDSGSFRIIGEALRTYIIVEFRNSLWLIDKHAAHERIHFDALRKEGYSPMSQALITPVVCRIGREDETLLLENAELLDSLGFTVESFGEDAVAVRRIPSDIEISDAEPVLSDICTQLRQGGTAEPERDSLLRLIACKAAIKAGSLSGTRELEELTSRVLSGEISHCPHGRPVAFELTKAALEKKFGRS